MAPQNKAHIYSIKVAKLMHMVLKKLVVKQDIAKILIVLSISTQLGAPGGVLSTKVSPERAAEMGRKISLLV